MLKNLGDIGALWLERQFIGNIQGNSTQFIYRESPEAHIPRGEQVPDF
jgi:hypothetical protein